MENKIFRSIGNKGIELDEPIIFARNQKNMNAVEFFDASFDAREAKNILGNLYYDRNNDLAFPEVSEQEAVRHFTRLSQKNFCGDVMSYPLGSCSMKYNPKINEWAARLSQFTSLHPLMPEQTLQHGLKVCYEMQKWLSQIAGFVNTSLAPSAGAHGEFAGLCMMAKALKVRGEKRTTIMVPSSAHGTNPATAAFFGWRVITIPINDKGRINVSLVKETMNEDCVGIMITNPNTLGIFESEHQDIADIVHNKGGFVYGDGANLNALLGIVRPGDIGVDVMHFNLHKTFTTPHGGGGPGCGAVGASKLLAQFLPSPLINFQNGNYFVDNNPSSIGRIRSYFNNFGLLVRAWVYLKTIGHDGLKNVSQKAVINANYLRHKLKDYYHLPYENDCLHEVVLSDKWQQEYGVSALDISKRLIDYGVHPPTMYFPLVVKGALMIEPTETESFYDLDYLANALIKVAMEAKENPSLVKNAPHNTRLARIDEVKAAREPKLTAFY